MGVFQFKSIVGKIGFLKKTSRVETSWADGAQVWFKSNDPIEKRDKAKDLGYIKHPLVNTKSHDAQEGHIKQQKRAEASGASVTYDEEGLGV